MKLITAFIKPLKLTDVTLALHEIEGLTGASVTEVRGFGRGRRKDTPQRTREESADFLRRVRLEVYCSDELVDRVVAAIEKSAHTGLRGDGKIYVSNVEQAVRISTGERGAVAV